MEKWIQTSDFKVKRGDIILDIGDYIEYHDCAGENGTDLYEGKWQVLGADDEGRLLIVSEDNVTVHAFNKELTLEGAMESYSKGVDTLDKICEVYGRGTGAKGARSIRIEDVNKVTGYDITKNKYNQKVSFDNEDGNTFIWHDGQKWKCTKSKKTIVLTNSYYWYAITCETNLMQFPKAYKMLFSNNNLFYWLASTYVNTRSYNAKFGIFVVCAGTFNGIDFVYNNERYESGICGVRAVVTLKSDI